MNSQTRIAPTPSGWLHIGNLCSFLLTRMWADHARAQLLLRIDDLDSDRTRDIYVEDIFNQLKWAEIKWELGPSNSEDHRSIFSQQWSFEFYQAVLEDRQKKYPDLFFVCQCSRKDKAQGKVCECRSGNFALQTHQNALMLDLKSLKGKNIQIMNFFGVLSEVPFGFASDEIPIIRREGIFSYHWVSLNEDRKHRINFIIRGKDLWESTLLQLGIEQMLFPEEPSFAKAGFLHHPVLTGPDGHKLSKSESSQSLMELRNQGFSKLHLYRIFADFVGARPPESFGAEETLQFTREFLKSRWDQNQQ